MISFHSYPISVIALILLQIHLHPTSFAGNKLFRDLLYPHCIEATRCSLLERDNNMFTVHLR